ncbi:MAG: formate--tetrahydrofolate ligase [Candidatus Treponema excrementipullorum]|nr:formate--tetrahydrofolate ligase [Spirochaetia bacterium]MDD7011312.1 formate--tetrahydrofolate ligase [Candidatus Treponema excrementipullorum]MCI6953437.1 formate--tetrahydrofolate ligase [Spirochaetia bacterium]MCI7588334.1 formate--tetrahydrofolate ligase [Spirochaetia bacterium]MDY4466917.1 formate--tetrahydrofolate ligase [Candidatus Treponema excrementipullorum]
MLSDIEIVQKNIMEPISVIAHKIGLGDEDIDYYGKYKAKISLASLKKLQNQFKDKPGKLILVTAITPTPAGEGKSTVSIGLGDGLNRIGKKAVIALREPSLGPCFGIKGGACGGGYSQIVPMEDINLHFTGDIHAVSITTNLIASLIDNHIQQGNSLNIDPRTVTWKRCVDLNDRALRNVIVGLGGRTEGVPREDNFTIAVASEIMAILCLSRSIAELKEKLGNIIVGYTYDKETVYFRDLKCVGAAAALLKDAIRPNLVQTLEKTPVFVHGGPFANIAHGCNSLNATMCALALGDYVVTEAGFAADLGAEKFFDIKCRVGGLQPSAVVIVATIRALKMHGGIALSELHASDPEAVRKGFENLAVHIENVKKFGLPALVALNRFTGDSEEEISVLTDLCKKMGVELCLSEAWGKGSAGAETLAKSVVDLCESGESRFSPLYDAQLSLTEKLKTLAKEIYRADSVDIAPKALKKIAQYEEQGFGSLPICVAKTQNSISHEKTWRGAPKGYVFPIRDVQLYAGAGFIVAFAGDIMTMPGLPKIPAAQNIDVDDQGNISGIF